MKGYVLVDSTTNMVQSMFSWKNKEIDPNYPISDNCYLVEVNQDIFTQAQQKFPSTSVFLKVKNKDGLTYNDIFEEIPETLDQIKQNKINELSKICNDTILGKFEFDINSVVYYFSCDVEAQSNFEKVDRAFEKARITEINWTAYDINGNAERILFTQDTFETLYLAHLNHIQNNISKFRDTLMPKINIATTENEVNAIVWS